MGQQASSTRSGSMFLRTLMKIMVVASMWNGSQGAPLASQQVFLDDKNNGGREDQRALRGRFLHITDLHLDPFYRAKSSTHDDFYCHRGSGSAGPFGAPSSSCDSPPALLNAAFAWIEQNLRDDVDFIVWTGDSARHDNDDHHSRSADHVLHLNDLAIRHFANVWACGANKTFTIPIVPTWGNNDVAPHNQLTPGPNYWTWKFLRLWRNFIPSADRSTFADIGSFAVEVIPARLTVLSLNTLYFYAANSATNGCSARGEPGTATMAWLHSQLDRARSRSMKALLIGHVPPARTESKENWQKSCWREYGRLVHAYRDVVVGSVYGHMNIDHFMLQDFTDVEEKEDQIPAGESTMVTKGGKVMAGEETTAEGKGKMIATGTQDYLTELRKGWSKLPEDPQDDPEDGGDGKEDDDKGDDSGDNGKDRKQKDGKKEKEEKKERKKQKRKQREKCYLDKIGGPWAERYSLSLISPSIVPNYFPSLRIIHYNISGLEDAPTWSDSTSNTVESTFKDGDGTDLQAMYSSEPTLSSPTRDLNDAMIESKRNHHLPEGPSASAPPGPAYSPQPLSLTGYTQLYVNLTVINGVVVPSESSEIVRESIRESEFEHQESRKDDLGRDDGYIKKPTPVPFSFEVLYDTRDDAAFALPDLSVRSFVELAARIGRYRPRKGDLLGDGNGGNAPEEEEVEEQGDDGEGESAGGEEGEEDWKEEGTEMQEMEEDSQEDQVAEDEKPAKESKGHNTGNGRDVLDPQDSATINSISDARGIAIDIHIGDPLDLPLSDVAAERSFGTDGESDMDIKTKDHLESTNPQTIQKHKNRKHKHKHKHARRRRAINRVWFAFVRRAFVGAVADDDLHERFGQPLRDDGKVGGEAERKSKQKQKWYTEVEVGHGDGVRGGGS